MYSGINIDINCSKCSSVMGDGDYAYCTTCFDEKDREAEELKNEIGVLTRAVEELEKLLAENG